jgi:glucans biosynthesis protein
VNQNVIAYWRPRNGLTAGSEVSFAYRQFWCWSPPERPDLATVSVSRAGRSPGSGTNTRRRRFLVEFSGDTFADVQRSQDVTANLWAAPGNILGTRSFLSPDRKAYRVQFDVEAGSDTLMEMRLLLEMQGKPISETWLYRWTV